MEFQRLLKELQQAPLIPMGDLWRIGGDPDTPEEAVLYFTPCLNYRTKTLTALLASETDIRIVTVVIPRDLRRLSNEDKGELTATMNARLREVGYRILHLSTSGMHVNISGNRIVDFEMGGTKIISFRVGEIQLSDVATTGREFEVPYRGTIFTVTSPYFTEVKSLDSIYMLVNGLLPNVYNL